MLRIATALAAVVLAALTATAIAAPVDASQSASFDCRRASNPSERTICADPRLAALDRQLALAYRQRLAGDASVRRLQRGWLKARSEGCGRNSACLRRFMTAQLDWLLSRAPPPRRLPAREGVCDVSSMKDVAYRLEGVADSGTSVEEANGAVQVWYEDVPEAARSRVGDPALVCLVSIPRGCPPGDARGRIYAVANLRTLGAWSGPDAEHMCGGA
jgi:uncharacterized protein